MSEPPVLFERRGAALHLTLNRPKVHNAFDEHLIAALTGELEKAASDPSLRAVVLTGAGRSFSAGADLDWMRRMAAFDEARNLEDARALERLLRTLDELPLPTIALVNGAAIGGGVGLVACCDVAIGAESALFALSEVRLGLVPATIGPYVVRAVGERACRRLFLTAERFAAAEAVRLGLLHEAVPEGELEARGEAVLADMLRGGPDALREAKRLLHTIREEPPAGLGEATARLIAGRRASKEGREGIAAFLAKRPAPWVQG